MEIAYLLAGNRFRAKTVEGLNSELSRYGLITNLHADGTGIRTVRSLRDTFGTTRYDIVQSHGDSADIDGFDVCVGKVITRTFAQSHNDFAVARVELSDIARTLAEVKQDIPDAELLIGSYWS